MRIVIDTNVLISAFGYRSTTLRALVEFVAFEHHWVMPEYIAAEFIRVMHRKAPLELTPSLDFLSSFSNAERNEMSESPATDPAIRDIRDQPIVRFIMSANIDIIITGDKDFHALGLDRPRVMSPSDFIAEFLDS